MVVSPNRSASVGSPLVGWLVGWAGSSLVLIDDNLNANAL